MLQNPCKTLGFNKKYGLQNSPGGEVNHIQPVAYNGITDVQNYHLGRYIAGYGFGKKLYRKTI